MRNIIFGKNSVIDAFKANVPIKKVYATNNTINLVPKHLDAKVLSMAEMDKLVKGNHQGLIIEIKEVNYFNIKDIFVDKPEKVLILDHIQDPHNFGAILRTANAAGVRHIILPKNRSVEVTPTVLKVASGGQVGTKIIKVESLQVAVKDLKDNGYWIYATALDENAKSHKQASFNKPMAIIIGNEQKGVNRTLIKAADELVYIPMNGTVQSLNVSVATGIILFSI